MPLIFDLSGRYVALSLERQTDFMPAISGLGRTVRWGKSPAIATSSRLIGNNISYSTISAKGNTGEIAYKMQLLSPALFTTIQETDKNV